MSGGGGSEPRAHAAAAEAAAVGREAAAAEEAATAEREGSGDERRRGAEKRSCFMTTSISEKPSAILAEHAGPDVKKRGGLSPACRPRAA